MCGVLWVGMVGMVFGIASTHAFPSDPSVPRSPVLDGVVYGGTMPFGGEAYVATNGSDGIAPPVLEDVALCSGSGEGCGKVLRFRRWNGSEVVESSLGSESAALPRGTHRFGAPTWDCGALPCVAADFPLGAAIAPIAVVRAAENGPTGPRPSSNALPINVSVGLYLALPSKRFPGESCGARKRVRRDGSIEVDEKACWEAGDAPSVGVCDAVRHGDPLDAAIELARVVVENVGVGGEEVVLFPPETYIKWNEVSARRIGRENGVEACLFASANDGVGMVAKVSGGAMRGKGGRWVVGDAGGRGRGSFRLAREVRVVDVADPHPIKAPLVRLATQGDALRRGKFGCSGGDSVARTRVEVTFGVGAATAKVTERIQGKSVVTARAGVGDGPLMREPELRGMHPPLQQPIALAQPPSPRDACASEEEMQQSLSQSRVSFFSVSQEPLGLSEHYPSPVQLQLPLNNTGVLASQHVRVSLYAFYRSRKRPLQTSPGLLATGAHGRVRHVAPSAAGTRTSSTERVGFGASFADVFGFGFDDPDPICPRFRNDDFPLLSLLPQKGADPATTSPFLLEQHQRYGALFLASTAVSVGARPSTATLDVSRAQLRRVVRLAAPLLRWKRPSAVAPAIRAAIRAATARGGGPLEVDALIGWSEAATDAGDGGGGGGEGSGGVGDDDAPDIVDPNDARTRSSSWADVAAKAEQVALSNERDKMLANVTAAELAALATRAVCFVAVVDAAGDYGEPRAGLENIAATAVSADLLWSAYVASAPIPDPPFDIRLYVYASIAVLVLLACIVLAVVCLRRRKAAALQAKEEAELKQEGVARTRERRAKERAAKASKDPRELAPHERPFIPTDPAVLAAEEEEAKHNPDMNTPIRLSKAAIASGLVFSKRGALIGSVDPATGIVRDKRGKRIGKATDTNTPANRSLAAKRTAASLFQAMPHSHKKTTG